MTKITHKTALLESSTCCHSLFSRGRARNDAALDQKIGVAIRPQQAHGPRMFNYDVAAELFFGQPGMHTRSRVGYRRFSSASTAVQFAVEKLSADVLKGTCLEVNEERFSAADIRSLYEHADFPLARKAR